MRKKIFTFLLALAASVGMSWATPNSIVINGTPQVGDNSISLTYYFDPDNVPGITGYAPTLKVKCVTDNIWDEVWLSLHEISSGTQTINLSTLGEFKVGKSYDVCFAYFNGSWVDDVFQSFTPAAPTSAVIDLATITTDYVIPDGATLTGTLQNNVILTVADNATITLSDVNINWNDQWTGGEHAGLTCNNATIILADCSVNRIKGFLDGTPGIHVRPNYTLTIEGNGTLYTATHGGGAGIGCGYGSGRNGGNIVINGGTIYATGGVLAAGIGAGGRARIGNITINGGIICANAGSASAGIGCGQTKNNSEKSQCGNITISANVTYLKATKASDAAHSIGKGSNSGTALCGTVTVAGETGYKSYNPFIYSPAANNVKNLINAIGSVAYTQACKDKIDAARAAYEALADYSCDVDAVNALKGEVSNYNTLTAAETAYDHAAADAVIDKINAISSPITAADQAAIEDARAAYDALTDTQKGYVTNYNELTDAEAALAVVNLINAIGSPITAASQSAIEDARNAYDALTSDQQALVGNYATLTDAEAALAVVNQIAAIGEVTLSSGSTIADVRTAYDALTGDQQALVGNYATLTAAEATYNTLVTDHAAADAVIDKINAISSPITAADQTAIEDARAAYDALTDTQKGYVTNYSELTDAEAALAVVNLINAIGSPITAADQTAIEDARAAYDALTGDQQTLVGNLSALTDAEAALAVVNLINAIDDPVVYTDACHQEILDAREAYDALSDEQKALVDATKLTDAEDAYASLNVDITAKLDPVNAGVYYSTFYDGSRQLQLPANVEAYTATVSGDKMLLKKVAVPGDILPAATAVVLRASQADFSLIPSAASPVSVENNALRGTDVNMEVPSEHCYVLSGADGFVGFYPLSTPYTLSAHKAYIDLDNLPGGANNAPRRLRFVFSEEQTTTGMENVQNEETKAQKVMIDGVMYIIRGELMYDAQGRIVK